MMVFVETYLRSRQRQLRQWSQIPGVRSGIKLLRYFSAGFLLSAVSLGNSPQPFAMGLCCILSGWRCFLAGLGSALGYCLFWGDRGLQGVLWSGIGTAMALLLQRKKELRDMPLLLPSMAAFFVSALGLFFQVLWLEEAPFGIYALRVGVAAGSVLCFQKLREKLSYLRYHSSTGFAQVQLELSAGVLAEAQQLLLESPEISIDESALLDKAKFRACNGCVLRMECRERENLNTYHLHHPLEFACRKPGRILGELRRGREQLLSLRRERGQQQEYRWALVQQYQFLGEYLQSLSDNLLRPPQEQSPRYRIQVSARSRGKGASNGDTCMAFPGTRCRYYVALCDGMGTGLGAAQQGQQAAQFLKKMLCAGLSPRHAFRTINSILTLRGQAGMVTLDLAEVELTTGKTRLYKWGAASSWLFSETEMERIGYATPPPGISASGPGETVFQLNLRHGENLILLSDGADIQEAVLRGKLGFDMPPGELAATILKFSRSRGEDDATAAVLRLSQVQEVQNENGR